MTPLPQRPPRRALLNPGSDRDRLLASSRASYTPNEAYKQRWLGRIIEGTDANMCPPNLPRVPVLQEWLQAAIIAGHVGGEWVEDFPSQVWVHRADGQAFQGALYHESPGVYYGFPIDAVDLPAELQ